MHMASHDYACKSLPNLICSPKEGCNSIPYIPLMDKILHRNVWDIHDASFSPAIHHSNCCRICPIHINGILSTNLPPFKNLPEALGDIRTLRLAGIQVNYIQSNQSWIVNLLIGELGISNGLVTWGMCVCVCARWVSESVSPLYVFFVSTMVLGASK